MVAFANSSAMDAAASGGGPSTTVLPSIVTGQPAAIVAYAGDIVAKVARLSSHLAAMERARDELSKVWSSGSARENVLTKLSKTFTSFSQIIESANSAVQELGAAAAKLGIAQMAYNVIVNVVNPIVAALMSNPWTAAAASALASAATGILKAFVEAIGAVMKIIGSVNIIKIVTDLVSIYQMIESLASGGHDDGGATASANAAITSTPVAAPAAVATVATAAGQSALNGGSGPGAHTWTLTDPSGHSYYLSDAGLTNSVPAEYAYRPAALDPSNSWIAVDPAGSATTAGTTGVADLGSAASTSGGGGGGGGSVVDTSVGTGGGSTGGAPGDVPTGADGHHDVTITASKGDLQMTVTVPVDSGQQLDMDINLQSGSQTLHEHIDVGADGSVTVG